MRARGGISEEAAVSRVEMKVGEENGSVTAKTSSFDGGGASPGPNDRRIKSVGSGETAAAVEAADVEVPQCEASGCRSSRSCGNESTATSFPVVIRCGREDNCCDDCRC